MNREPLRVGYDLTPVISGATGIARYVTELARALAEREVELRTYAIGRAVHPVPPGTRRWRVPSRVVSGWWRRSALPSVEQLTPGAALVHATGVIVPRTRLPLVVTVHDLAALHHPELHPPRHVRQLRAVVDALPRAAAVLTVSQATADDLAHLGQPPERIFVAPLGATALPEPRRPDGLEPGYLLTVGESSPRKDYPLLLQAFARLASDARLVMAGPPAGDEPPLRRLIEELGLAGRVIRFGSVDDSTLAGLYAGARALCFPSRAEGFGLPLLEAMQAGCPVVARDLPVTREVAGEAALLVDSDQAAEWAAALRAVLAEDDLAERLAAEGPRRAAGFGWSMTAERTLAAYRAALGSGG